MPFNASFTCLWCGSPHMVRTPDDVEGWAQLCPACVGRAGENGFLRFRLRQALFQRGASTHAAGSPAHAAGSPVSAAGPPAAPAPRPAPDEVPDETLDEVDDRYLRRGRFARGPIHDAAWNAELDAAGRWLDALPIRGEIVELVAGSGWWSTLLAGKGTLSVYDPRTPMLDRARDRLVAHRLRAHLHVRPTWAEPDRQVDALFVGPGLGPLGPDGFTILAGLARRWLKSGGTFAAIIILPDPLELVGDQPGPGRAGIESGTGGEPVPTVDPEAIRAALLDAGFAVAQVLATGRFLVLMTARA